MAVVHLGNKVKSTSGSERTGAVHFGPGRRQERDKGAADILSIAERYAIDRRSLAPGMELFAEGETPDSLFVVLDGWLNIHRIFEDGRRQILDFALPGAVLGYRPTPDLPLSFSAEAMTAVTVAVIPLTQVAALLGEGSAIGVTLLSSLSESLLGAFDSLTDIGRRTAREAVAHFLLRMDRRIRLGRQMAAGEAVPFPLTQEHIGDALGLTAVHVCRTLRTLRADGLVTMGGGSLRIHDADALAREAAVYLAEPDLPRLAS